MHIALPLDKMSIEEKIGTMEMLWNDLSKNPENIEAPEWHGKVLKERETQLKSENDEFIDWNTAKKNIRDSTS